MDQSLLGDDVVASSTAAAGAPRAPTRPPGGAPGPSSTSSGALAACRLEDRVASALLATSSRESPVAGAKNRRTVGFPCGLALAEGTLLRRSLVTRGVPEPALTTARRAGPRPRPPAGGFSGRQSDGTQPGPLQLPRSRWHPPHR
ncbi:Hypothetical predicted protein [Xyrichtys novacula]|uniref:Uncharacterized protein n=1 Tax=Xyrichtys novacula TaxID=13765 RepID=A0AAV1FL77_XYRNO|nr:Hypothetical predicted protein [Xyrichtys novacula]